MVIRPATAARLLIASGQLCHIRRNIDGVDADLFALCFRGSRHHVRENRNHQQRDDRDMQPNRDHVARVEVLVFRPYIFYLYRFYSRRQWSLFRRREEIPDSVAESAEIRAPGYRQPAVHPPFVRWARAQKLRQIACHSGAKACLREGRIRALAHLDGTLEEELLQVRPKIIWDQNLWGIEFWHRRVRY